jgi:hypothetical protein
MIVPVPIADGPFVLGGRTSDLQTVVQGSGPGS